MVFKLKRGGGGLGLVKQGRTQQQNVLKNLQHPLLKRAPGVCEKTFSSSLEPQPAENNNYTVNPAAINKLLVINPKHQQQLKLSYNINSMASHTVEVLEDTANPQMTNIQ